MMTPTMVFILKFYGLCLIPALYFTYQQYKTGIAQSTGLGKISHFLSVWLITPVFVLIMIYKFIKSIFS